MIFQSIATSKTASPSPNKDSIPSGMMTMKAVPINKPAPRVVTFLRTLYKRTGQRYLYVQQDVCTAIVEQLLTDIHNIQIPKFGKFSGG